MKRSIHRQAELSYCFNILCSILKWCQFSCINISNWSKIKRGLTFPCLLTVIDKWELALGATRPRPSSWWTRRSKDEYARADHRIPRVAGVHCSTLCSIKGHNLSVLYARGYCTASHPTTLFLSPLSSFYYVKLHLLKHRPNILGVIDIVVTNLQCVCIVIGAEFCDCEGLLNSFGTLIICSYHGTILGKWKAVKSD